MRQDYKIIKEEYNKETFVSIVSIQTDIGVFTGKSKAHDIDCKYPSMFHGHEIALTKALLKFAIKTVKIINKDIELLTKMKKEIRDDKTFEAKIIKTYLLNSELEKSHWINKVEHLKKHLEQRNHARDLIVDRYETKK